jgi:hypothetical protein
MSKKFLLFLLLVMPFSLFALPGKIDSLNSALEKEKADTMKAILLRKLSGEYKMFRPDTALILAQKALLLSRKINYRNGFGLSLHG